MDTHPVDLTPVDPTLDDRRRERLVAAIVRRAEPELQRRAAQRSPILVLARWARPALAAAAVVGAVATGTLALSTEPDARADRAEPVAVSAVPTGYSDALEVPAPVAAFVVAEREPTVDDVISALEGEIQ